MLSDPSAKHSSEVLFLQEDGISRQFVYAGMLLLFCAIVLIITVMVSYLETYSTVYVIKKNGNINVRCQEDDLDRSRYLLCGRNVHWFFLWEKDCF